MAESLRPASGPPLPIRSEAFLVVCAVAGALAVPAHVIATPISAIVAGLMALVGIRVWRWSRLADIVGADVSRRVGRLALPALWLSVGLVVGLILLGAIRIVIEPAIPSAGARIETAGALPLWRRVAIIYVAAVGDELVFRMFLLSLAAGLGARLFRSNDQMPSPRILWSANLLAALAFAAAHLPAWNAVGPLGLGTTVVVLGLNGFGGLILGYAFVRHGIIAAIWAHAGADCAILLIGPLTH